MNQLTLEKATALNEEMKKMKTHLDRICFIQERPAQSGNCSVRLYGEWNVVDPQFASIALTLEKEATKEQLAKLEKEFEEL